MQDVEIFLIMVGCVDFLDKPGNNSIEIFFEIKKKLGFKFKHVFKSWHSYDLRMTNTSVNIRFHFFLLNFRFLN
jgi:hypothetical protein